jgi:hypothetical protein
VAVSIRALTPLMFQVAIRMGVRLAAAARRG